MIIVLYKGCVLAYEYCIEMIVLKKLFYDYINIDHYFFKQSKYICLTFNLFFVIVT